MGGVHTKLREEKYGSGRLNGPSLGENESSNFPGSSFEIFRVSILAMFVLQNMFGKYVGEISRNK